MTQIHIGCTREPIRLELSVSKLVSPTPGLFHSPRLKKKIQKKSFIKKKSHFLSRSKVLNPSENDGLLKSQRERERVSAKTEHILRAAKTEINSRAVAVSLSLSPPPPPSPHTPFPYSIVNPHRP